MKERLFRFRQFCVNHSRSAMKVGVDGVLIGCWADVANCSRILDVGSGCGLVALMVAQRAEAAEVEGIEIDVDSCEESLENIAASPWKSRIKIYHRNFAELLEDKRFHGRYDYLVSNPPFFNSGADPMQNSRLAARHDGDLSPISLLDGHVLLSDKGKIGFIAPYDRQAEIMCAIEERHLHVARQTIVKGHDNAEIKRVLIEASKDLPKEIEEGILVLESTRGVRSPEYDALTKDFYLPRP